MNEKTFDTVVIGAGQAGLGAAEQLARRGLEFIVLERGLVGQSWRSQRWDSFALNTPTWASGLAGMPCDDGPRDGFLSRDRFVDYLARYARRFGERIRTGARVVAVERDATRGSFIVRIDGARAPLCSKTVIVAAGILQSPKLPPYARTAIASIRVLHAGEYRSARELPPGAVLVVGSAQSGVQITEDLLSSGRPVFLSTSRVARAPRRHRGRDVFDWFVEMGVMDERADELSDAQQKYAPQSQISGVGRYGHTVSLQSLAAAGATLLGHLRGIRGTKAECSGDLGENARFADERSQTLKTNIDAFIERRGLTAPRAEPDAADVPAPELYDRNRGTELDLVRSGVGAVVYCTGFTADFSWIEGVTLQPDGVPSHTLGEAPIPGLYYLGFPWLSRRKSGLVWGVNADAEHVVSRIAERLS